MQASSQITYVFIDSQNLYLGIKAQGWELDYRKFHRYLVEKYKVNRVFLYIGYLESNAHLYALLQSYGFEIVFKLTQRYGKNRQDVKGNIDVDLVVDVIRKINEFQIGIFISADGDFLPLYDFLIDEKKKEIMIMIPNKRKYSRLLLKYGNRLRFMNSLESKLGK